MVISTQPVNYNALASREAYILEQAYKRSEKSPLIPEFYTNFFKQLKEEGHEVPDILITSFRAQVAHRQYIEKKFSEHKTCEEKCYRGCAIAETIAVVVTGVLFCHSLYVPGAILCGSATTVTGGGAYCVNKCCSHNPAPELMTARENEIRRIFLEAVDFSEQPDNSLKKFLEQKIETIDIDLASPGDAATKFEYEREKNTYQLALDKVNEFIAHFKQNGFVLQAEEIDPSAPSENLSTPLLTKAEYIER